MSGQLADVWQTVESIELKLEQLAQQRAAVTNPCLAPWCHEQAVMQLADWQLCEPCHQFITGIMLAIARS